MNHKINFLLFWSTSFFFATITLAEAVDSETSQEINISGESLKNTVINFLEPNFTLQAVLPIGWKPADPILPDLLTMIKDFGGKSDISLFSGSLGFQYPLNLPAGRLDMTPMLGLNYSSNNRNFASLLGYGWEMTGSSIFRSTTLGVDQLYSQDHFTANLNGSAQELIVLDGATGLYGAKVDEGFVKYEKLANGWRVTSTDGKIYTFGVASNAQQADPQDPTRIYKWLLERVEDLNGNFITYTYTHDQGQVYPNTIRYTGHSVAGDGLYEVRFVLGNRPAYTDYRRGFAVTTGKRIESIQVYRTDTNDQIYRYDLDFSERNNAVQLLTTVTQHSGPDALPSTGFSYFDGTENLSGQRINLMKQIDHPYGATESYLFEPSTVPRVNGQAANPLPFVVHTLAERQLQSVPGGPIHTSQYTYSGGHYFYDAQDAHKKEYAGFHEVSVTDPLGNLTKHYFHQSENSEDGSALGEQADHLSKKGRTYLIENEGDQGNLLRRTWNHWQHQALTDADPDRDRFQVYLDETIIADYAAAGVRAHAISYAYDGFGNTTEEMDFGEVSLLDTAGNYTDLGTDSVKITYEYAQNVGIHLVAKPWRIKTFNHQANRVAQTIMYYDGVTNNGDVDTLTVGNETRRKILAAQGPNVQFTTNLQHNALGQLNKRISPEGQITTWAYNSKKLQPKNTDNALGQRTEFEYDLRFGQVSQVTDPNGLVLETDYDGFGRQVAVRQTDPANVGNLVTLKTTAYDHSAYPAQITDTVFTGVSGTAVVGIRYIDGLGRLLQTRQEADSGQFIVTDLGYNARGENHQIYLPEFQTGSMYVALNSNNPKVETSFDALGRTLMVVDPTGSTQISYDGWTTLFTNKLGNLKTTISDAFGRLQSVEELLGAQTLSTSYDYDSVGNLLKITDAQNNTREHQYDMANRRTSQGQWRISGAPALATTFVYDKNGNVTSQTDPRAETITTVFDALNRPLTVTSSAGINTFQYDTALYGIGRIASISVPGLSKTFAYDVAGRPTSESQAIGTENFLTQKSYDWRGQQIGITTPDGLSVDYLFNSAGQITGVSSGADTIAQTIEYGPHGHITRLVMGNGTETLNSFDPQQLHRLTGKVTTMGTAKLQDLSYTLDAEGNVQQIVDASDTDTAHDAAYTYDDLQRLLSVSVTNAANGQNYSRSYGYDSLGNQTSRSDTGASIFSENHPHLATSDATSATYSYDAAGNQTSDGLWAHAWNAYGQLSGSNDGTSSITYEYDEGGSRFKKSGTNNTLYVGKTFERDEAESKTYVFLGALKLATKTTDLTPNN